MNISILKRNCSTHLVSAMLMSALITQSFAGADVAKKHRPSSTAQALSHAVQSLKTKLTRRTNAYNAQPDQPSIPRDTS